MTPDHLISLIQPRLREMADGEYASSLETTMPGLQSYDGVRVPDLRALAAELTRDHQVNPVQWVGYLNQVFPGRHRELILVGVFGLDGRVTDFDDLFGERLSGWARHLDNWETTDQLAPTVGAWLLDDLSRIGYPVAWAVRGENVWKKRLAAVSTIYLNRGGHAHTHESLRVLRHLMEAKSPELRKAVAWALREQADQDAVERFLAWWAPRIPRAMLREASKKLSEPQQQRLLELSRD